MRSLLFVPGHVSKFLASAVDSDASAIIFDLEDAVPLQKRDEARENLRSASDLAEAKGMRLIVRVNPHQSRDFDLDICSLKDVKVDFLMPTKVNSTNELDAIFRVTKIKQIPLIETARGLVECHDIAKLSFVDGLALGAEDLMDDLDVRAPGYAKVLEHAKIKLSVACKAASKSCYDTPFLSLDDLEGYSLSCRESYGLGFNGRLCIHPSQLSPTNRYYFPSQEEQSFAKEIQQKIVEAEDSGYSVIRWKGELVGPPMVKRAMSILRAMNDD